MDKEWIQDIMSQQFAVGTFLNPIRLIIATYLVQNPISNRVSKSSTLEYVYRTFADHKEIADRNPNIMIRNIQNYGLSDISASLDEALYDWCADAKNHTISYDNRWIYFDVDVNDASIQKSTMQVIQMLYKKYFKSPVLTPIEIKDEEIEDDMNLEEFGTGIFKRRVLEDMQYCPLCEETRQDNLYAVHIVPNNRIVDVEQKTDKANGILLCKEHAKAYINEEFYFNSAGFVECLKCTDLDRRMHLSFSILNKKRKKYLRAYEVLMKNSESHNQG